MKKLTILWLSLLLCFFTVIGVSCSPSGVQTSESNEETSESISEESESEEDNSEENESEESDGKSESEYVFTIEDIPSSLSVGANVSIPFATPQLVEYELLFESEELKSLVEYDGENLTVSEQVENEFSFIIIFTKDDSLKQTTVTVRPELLKLNKTVDLFLNEIDGDKNIEILKDLGLFRGVNKNTVYSAKFVDSGNSIPCKATEKGVTLDLTDDLFGEWDIILSMNGEEIEFRVAIITKAISTAEELVNFKSYAIVTDETVSPRDNEQVYKMDGFFTLANNIDFTNYRTTQKFSYAPWACEKGGNNWGLIGTFDGRNYTIYGGYYAESGIFGCIGDGAVVKNLAIVNATVEGDRKGVLAREIRNCLIENVLIEVVSVRYVVNGTIYNLTNGGAIGSLIYNATLKNVVVYFPLNENASNGALANYIECTMDNVYVISNSSIAPTNKVSGEIYTFLFGTTCDKIDFVGFDDNWIFTGEKAEFVSTGNFLF